MAAIEVAGLHVRRGGRPVLGGLDLEVRTGAVTGLVGPSGGGKSTLIRAIVGVQRLERGVVTVLGRPAGEPGLRRQVAYMPQGTAVYEDLTVEENVRYFGRVAGQRARRIGDALDLVELGPLRRRLVSTLSGGEHARVSLAAALLGDPRLLVLDEPTVGLDPVLRADLWAMFRRLAAGGATLLVSSHVMDEAAECDDLVLLRDGVVLAHAGPADLRRRTGEADLSRAFLALIRSAA
jgi:ABC-2 type transport system ATP-binding protein